MSISQQKKLLAKAMRLERKIESATKDEPSEGFAPNTYGRFEPIDTREKEFEIYRELISKFPHEGYFRYSFAASLWRSAMYDEAIEQYTAVIDAGDDYGHPSHKMLACVFYEAGDKSRAQEYLDLYNKEAARRGEAVTHQLVGEMYAS